MTTTQSFPIAPTPVASCAPRTVGQHVVLLGWVHRVRDLGGVTFFDLRDRHGLTQVVVAQRHGRRRGDLRRSVRNSSWP